VYTIHLVLKQEVELTV